MSKKPNKRALRRGLELRQPAKKISTAPRNACLDTLRGLAILLMLVDHMAGMLFGVDIEPTSLRMFTRLSMPLFCILMGYFLESAKETNWNRFLQLLAATVAVNLIFFRVYGKLEILASLSVAYVLFVCLKNVFPVFVAALFFYQIDASQALLDYPLSVVLSCVALGVVLRRYQWKAATIVAAVSLCGVAVVDPPTVYILYFILPATLLIAWGIEHPSHQVTWLTAPGRYPLSVYLLQYTIILAIAASLGRLPE